MAGRVQLEGGRLRMWDENGVKTFDSDEVIMHGVETYAGTINVPVVDNRGNMDDIRGQRIWPISNGPLKPGATFAQGMVNLTMVLDGGVIWNRNWMVIGGSLCTIQRAPRYYVHTHTPRWLQVHTQLQYLTLEIQNNELVFVENFAVKGRAGMGGYGFSIPAMTLGYAIAVGGFN